jgi:RNA polymerase primary sigma factor
LLDKADEATLIEAAKAGDRSALQVLIERYLPLIGSVARSYRTSTVERTDLLQEGVVGLMRALERYDPKIAGSLWTYASWWVRQAMQQLMAELTRPVILSDRALRELARLKNAHRDHLQAAGKEPTPTQLACATGLAKDRVENLIASDQTPRSLEEPASTEEGTFNTFGELLRDPLAEDEYEQALDAFEAQELQGLLGTLTEREREILRLRYGLDEPEQTLAEIGEGLGLSAERVRQLEDRALTKLRTGAISDKTSVES